MKQMMSQSALALSLALLASALVPTPTPLVYAEPGQKARFAGPPWLGLIADGRYIGDGVHIKRVLRDSPAARAGLAPGDVITAIDGDAVDSPMAFKMRMRRARPGQALTLTVERARKPRPVELTPAPMPSQTELIRGQLMGRAAPAVAAAALRSERGTDTVELEQLEGKPTVLEFWATWCRACKPYHEQLARSYQKRRDQIHVLALTTESESAVRAYLERTGPRPYPVALDPREQIHKAFFVRQYPVVVLLDEDHRVRKVLTGADDPALLERALVSMLGEDKDEEE